MKMVGVTGIQNQVLNMLNEARGGMISQPGVIGRFRFVLCDKSYN